MIVQKVVRWSITLPSKNDFKPIKTQPFPVSFKQGNVLVTKLWYMQTYMGRLDNPFSQEKPFLYIKLAPAPSTNMINNIFIDRVQFSLISESQGRVINFSGWNYRSVFETDGVECCLIRSDDLYSKPHVLFPNGKLHFLVFIEFQNPENPFHSAATTSNFSFSAPLALIQRNSVDQLFDIMMTFQPDITIKLSDRAELKSNMKKLSEGSPVFAEMFTPEKLSLLNGIVEIDLDRPTMIELIRFIYTKGIKHLSNEVPYLAKLFAASCEYNICGLSEIYAKSAASFMNIDIVLDIVPTALKYDGYDQLFEECCRFIKIYFKYIKGKAKWQSMNPDIKLKVLEKIATLTWESEVEILDDAAANNVPRTAEVTEVHSNEANSHGGITKYVQYFIKPTARLKRGQMVLIKKVTRRNVTLSKFKDMEVALKRLN